MRVLNTLTELNEARAVVQGSLGLVPTMGFLHEGHLSLVEAARADCNVVVVSIFVNPTQFGPGEDYQTYPRDLQSDLNLLEQAGVDLVFVPAVELIYPLGFQTYVQVEQVTLVNEGAIRPVHFRGVATIVAKLFNLVRPDYAYFGQKDAQQVAVIRRMVFDMHFPLQVVVCPIAREADGLARSSRNVFLKGHDRQASVALYQALQAAAETYEAGERDPNRLRATARRILDSVPGIQVDYVSLVDARTFVELEQISEQPLLLSVAARVGSPRLLDNCLLPRVLNTREGATAYLGACEIG